MIRAVFFDLDGTLYDRDAVVFEVARRQYETFRSHLRAVSEHQFVSRLVELDDHGYGVKSDVYDQVVREYGLTSHMAHLMEQDFWATYDQCCQPSEETLRVLGTLRQQGMKLGVITNGGVERQQAKLKALGFIDVFDVVLISDAEGIRKPDPRIFQRAMDMCSVSPAETLFVGDHPEADIAGARNAGLTPIWKRVPYWPMPFDDVIAVDSLEELLPICLHS